MVCSSAPRSGTRGSRRVDVTRARAMPGVVAVITGADLAADGLGGIPPVASTVGRDGKPMVAAAMPVLAIDRIRFVGEAVALVVAETLAAGAGCGGSCAGRDRRTRLRSRYRERDGRRCRALHDHVPGNIALDWRDGDIAAVDAAFARAAHVERVRLDDTRLAAVSLEPRAGIGLWDEKTERYTLIATTQGVAVVRKLLAEGVFKVPLVEDPRADLRHRRRVRDEGADLS